ncbi:ribosomal protein S7 [Patellaria atrata CBS 101060]|uniref:Small ribosomal subunit protein uS7m n=1 Tax=Patellaria atrata CBS 101060 TaxID=1346257 RepID=A0A9P4SFA2_9PEZI|nr:ribosomal protein S7 [Patellaria atrata CBS 101060]
MPPRLNLFAAPKLLAYRPRSGFQLRVVQQTQQSIRRGFADSKSPSKPEDKNAENAESLPHVSEEAAKMSEITGKVGPDLKQGSPVEEIVQGDKEAQEKLPKVLQDEIKSSNNPKGTRSYSTSAARRQDDLTTYTPNNTDIVSQTGGLILGQETTLQPAQSDAITTPATVGHKFPLPELPIPKNMHKDYRYDPVIEQVLGLIILHGKRAQAQRHMALILNHLRTSPPPTINPAKPLVPGAPPPSHLPLNPVLYLTLAIDSVAPLLRIRNQKGAAGGGVALQIPVPLHMRQRRRTAVRWILDAAAKRKNRGSGKSMFAQRVAEELIAVVEGRSAVWERRQAVHKLGISSRSNLNKKGLRRR